MKKLSTNVRSEREVNDNFMISNYLNIKVILS